LLSLAFQFIIIRSYFLSDHISPWQSTSPSNLALKYKGWPVSLGFYLFPYEFFHVT
jgi:hypothetical protein